MRSVRTKLLGSFVVVLAFVSVLYANGLMQIQKMGGYTEEITTHWMFGLETINEVNLNIEQFLSVYYQSMSVKDPEQLKKLNDTSAALVNSVDNGIKKYSETITDNNKDYEALKDAWARFQKELAVTTSGNADKDKVVKAGENAVKAFYDLRESVDKLTEYNRNGAHESQVESDKIYGSSERTFMIIGFIILIVIAVTAIALIVNLTRPLKATTAIMNRISSGDLTVEPLAINRKDEFGVMMTSVNKTLANLQLSVKQMQDASTSVATASIHLYTTSEQNAEAAKHVAGAILQVADGSSNQENTAMECGRVVDEMAEGVQRIAETTGEVSDLSQQTAWRANNGSEKMLEVSERMQRLHESVEQASETIHKLEEKSVQISAISSLINDIAARTNLLALNAAIEAARAGDHGKGFAVVAGEVRKLATQSDESSQGIIELIATIQHDTNTAAETMKQSLVEVQEGVVAAEHAEQAFKEIVTSTSEVSSRVQEVAAAAEQLAASSEEVAASIASMGHTAQITAEKSKQVAATTEQQLASSEEMTRSSETLSGIATELQTIVKEFNV